MRTGRAPEHGRQTGLRRTTRSGSGNDSEDVAGAQDEVVGTGVLDLGAAVLAVDDLVAHGHVQRDAVAVVVDPTRTDGQDMALLGLLLGGVRDDQPGGGGLLGVERLHDDPVLERLDVDRHVRSTSTFSHNQWWSSGLRDVGACRRRTPSRGSYVFAGAGRLSARVPAPTLALSPIE